MSSLTTPARTSFDTLSREEQVSLQTATPEQPVPIHPDLQSGVNGTRVLLRETVTRPQPVLPTKAPATFQNIPLEVVPMGGWNVNKHPEKLFTTPEQIERYNALIAQWLTHFPRERDTLIEQRLGIPSPIIRLESFVLPDGTIAPIEIEERPAGIGVSGNLNPSFAEKFGDLLGKWEEALGKKIGVLVSHERGDRVGDDVIWTQQLGRPLHQGLDQRDPGLAYLVRSEPGETDYHQIAPQSIATVKHKGDKSYGEPMGLWSRIQDPADLPWTERFVYKPLRGSKGKGIHVFSPVRKEFEGVATRGKIEAEFAAQGGGFVQPFHQPEKADFLPGDLHVLRRIFFGYDPAQQKYVNLGGFWTARKNIKIHGATDAIFGTIE